MEYNEVRLLEEYKGSGKRLNIRENRLVEILGNEDRGVGKNHPFVHLPCGDGSQFSKKAIYLNDDDFDWIIGRDMGGLLLCIPLKKEEK